MYKARNYAYLLLQGKVYGPHGNEPLSGVTINLRGSDREFKTVTDERGIFVFEKLPVQAFTVQIQSADGRVMHSVVRMGDHRPIRLRVGTGSGPGAAFKVRPEGRGVVVELPRRPAHWKKFWIEVGIIAGAGLIFLL